MRKFLLQFHDKFNCPKDERAPLKKLSPLIPTLSPQPKTGAAFMGERVSNQTTVAEQALGLRTYGSRAITGSVAFGYLNAMDQIGFAELGIFAQTQFFSHLPQIGHVGAHFAVLPFTFRPKGRIYLVFVFDTSHYFLLNT
jgi:hypothetical protein